VRDPHGAVVPNATVKVTDNSTGVEQTTVSSSDGNFLFPNLQFGSYKLTATATGFKTAVIASVVVESGRTTDVSVDLEVGTTSETVQVTASAEQLNTTTNEVGATISNKLVQNLPFGGRDGLNFAGLIAGNSRSNNQRNSTYNGLPNASLNITLDGMNNNSQRFKGKLFFFAYYEIQPQPSTSTLTQAVLTSAAQQGNYTYVGTDGVKRTVNLLTVARTAGFTSTVDPTIAGILSKINASQAGTSL